MFDNARLYNKSTDHVVHIEANERQVLWNVYITIYKHVWLNFCSEVGGFKLCLISFVQVIIFMQL